MSVQRIEVPELNRRAGAILLRRWRDAESFSQGAAAKRLEVTQYSISIWETGVRQPTVDLAFKLEEVSGGAVPARAWSVTWRQWKRDTKRTGTDG